MAYISLVRSTLEYGSIVWDPYKQQDIIKLEKIQRNAVRFILNDYKSRHEGCVTSMLERLNLPTLQKRRLDSRLAMMYKIVRGMVPALKADEVFFPIRNKRKIFNKTYTDFNTTNFVNKYVTVNSECYKVPEAKSEVYINSFFVKTVSDWNKLSDSIICAETLDSFKVAVQHLD